MTATSEALHESIQHQLESISMRLDAATDNLLHSRDLLIQNIEHQMLQLQEVRAALQNTAKLTSQLAGGSKPPAPQSAKVAPVGDLTLESLFAPLNAVARSAPAAEPEAKAAPLVETEVLFQEPPSVTWASDKAGSAVETAAQPAAAALSAAVATQTKADIDPALEKATLDELNEALTRAFAQMTHRRADS